MKSVRNNEKWRVLDIRWMSVKTDRNRVEKDYMTLQMSYQEKFEQGLERGLKQGIHCLVDAFRDYGHSDEEIKAAIIKKYQLSEEEAVSYL